MITISGEARSRNGYAILQDFRVAGPPDGAANLGITRPPRRTRLPRWQPEGAVGGTVLHQPFVSQQPQIAGRLLRLAKIVSVGLRFGLDQMVLDGGCAVAACRACGKWCSSGAGSQAARGAGCACALEPLSDSVRMTDAVDLPRPAAARPGAGAAHAPPVLLPSEQAIALLETFYGRPVDEVFDAFERTLVASASVAQVHFCEVAGRHRRLR